MIRVSLLFILIAAALAQQPAELIGSIDFYGYGDLDLAKLRAALPLHVGDRVPEDEPKEALNALRKAAGREVSINRVCCLANGRTLVFVGIAEKDAKPIQFNPQPQGTIGFPEDARQIFRDFEEHFTAAVARGDAGEDDSKGYALFADPAARADQLKLLEWTRAHTNRVYRVLAEARSAQQRAYAAQALGYAVRSPEQIGALVSAAFDSDEGVRNNAVRALGVLCRIGPEVTRQIPAERFIPLLHSLTWTDRNKGTMLLDQLSQSRDPAVLKLLHDRALQPLKEMAQWSSRGHAQASVVILGRLAGQDDDRSYQMTPAEIRNLIQRVQ